MLVDYKTYYSQNSSIPRLIYTFNLIPTKIPAAFYAKIDKLILKIIWECKQSGIAKTILNKNNKVGGLTLPNFKTYHKVPVIVTVWFWHKDRYTDGWTQTDSPEINPMFYGQLIFNKAVKRSFTEEIVFSTNGAQTTG